MKNGYTYSRTLKSNTFLFVEDQILIAFYQNFAHTIDVLGMVKSYSGQEFLC